MWTIAFSELLSPAWSRHNVLQPSQLGSVGQNSLLPTCLRFFLCFRITFEKGKTMSRFYLSPILADLASVLPSHFLNRG